MCFETCQVRRIMLDRSESKAYGADDVCAWPLRGSPARPGGRQPFFLAMDKVQVKYEMLRAHLVDGLAVTVAAASHGYSRPSFYLVEASFQERGMLGLLDERRGRQGPLKLTPEIIAHLRRAEPTRSGAELADEIERLFHIKLHRRTVERARRR